MRAVRIDGPRHVAVVDVPRPDPGADEVLVRVEATALCATDRRMAALGTDAWRIPGHEVAGTLADGTPVGIHPNLGCGRCQWCKEGLENRCPDHVDVGIHRDGGLAEWVAIPERHVVPLDGYPVNLAPLVEPLACCLHAISSLAVDDGAPAVVIGAGSLGILGMWAMQAAGARVAVMQRSEARRRLAAELGADAMLGPDEEPEDALGTSPGAVLVTAPGAEPIRWALERVSPGGRVHVFAGTPGGALVDANVVHYRHVALVGSTGSTVEDYRRSLELARSGVVPLERMPSHTIPLEEVPEVLLDPAPDPTTLKFMVRP
ncbi:MAG: alcohol dehydrogenase catalytic domain-containing protein [Actinomycetota bacterium]